MLFLAVVPLVMPAVFDLAVYGNLTENTTVVQSLSLLSRRIKVRRSSGWKTTMSKTTAIKINPPPNKETAFNRS